MQPITYLILAALFGVQAPLVDIIAPADPVITIQRIGAGSFSPQTLALIPYTIVLTNNSTHDITGLAVEWAAGGPPQVLLLGHRSCGTSSGIAGRHQRTNCHV